MRKITKDAVEAFFGRGKFSVDNTTVRVEDGVVYMILHGSAIAKRIGGRVEICDSGHPTLTTKERLNGILAHLELPRIFQKKGIWYLNNEPWNGNWIVIDHGSSLEQLEYETRGY